MHTYSPPALPVVLCYLLIIEKRLLLHRGRIGCVTTWKTILDKSPATKGSCFPNSFYLSVSLRSTAPLIKGEPYKMLYLHKKGRFQFGIVLRFMFDWIMQRSARRSDFQSLPPTECPARSSSRSDACCKYRWQHMPTRCRRCLFRSQSLPRCPCG